MNKWTVQTEAVIKHFLLYAFIAYCEDVASNASLVGNNLLLRELTIYGRSSAMY